MRVSLLNIVRMRVALWHLRKMAEHGERSVALQAGAPLVSHNIVAAVGALAFLAVAMHLKP